MCIECGQSSALFVLNWARESRGTIVLSHMRLPAYPEAPVSFPRWIDYGLGACDLLIGLKLVLDISALVGFRSVKSHYINPEATGH
jgi:hypothetical protein